MKRASFYYSFFFEILTSKSIRLQTVFIQKRFEINKKQIFSSEKIRNSGNFIYDYAHLLFGEDF